MVDAELVSLELIWDYAEQQGAINGYDNLNVDWFRWAGGYFPGHGNGGHQGFFFIIDLEWYRPFNAGTITAGISILTMTGVMEVR